ncbi:site-specific DNA-methyltransferase [Streptobacillus ratti]|uniref:site-specific DNA-methyltransferase n=1 Tax=Streptobacillus ratti TaxID=1720557 RepID=UPI0009327FA5|nr:site-specific DNA-methyltransferase [Streptobacillus ratti]
MSNLSKIKREKMLKYLEKLKKINNDDENIRAITEIETALNEKKYGLVWEDHSEKIDEIWEHNIPIFVEDEERKITAKEDEAYNFLLEGDNLHSLKLLEKTHKGKIDVIYIDPPYNTGNKDFIYDDCFIDKTDGYAHSKWLSFMEKRLLIARELLSDDGVIFISIDDNEQAQLKLLCDEIFDEKNILSTHHIQVRYDNKSLNEKNEWQPVMEYIFIYAKDKTKFKANQPYEKYDINKFVYSIKELSNGNEVVLGGKKVKIYKKGEWSIENYEIGDFSLLKETWASGSVLKGNTSGKFFDLYISNRKQTDGLGCLYKVQDIGEDGLGYRYFTGPQKENSIRGKFYSGIPLDRLNELKKGNFKKYKSITNLYDFSADFGNIRHEGGIGFNSGKKPIKLLKMLINYHKEREIYILDFFAGSGTTGHAVMQLNKEDGGNRKYILCTNNENNICEEVTYQRLKNIQTELPHNLKYYKTEFIPKFSNDEESVSDKMMGHIKELIELEYAIELDDKKYIVLNDEDELDEVISRIENDGKLFMRSGIFLSRNNQRIFEEKGVSIIEIPEYYFREEIKEVGEL